MSEASSSESEVEQPWLPEVVPFRTMAGKKVLEIGHGPGFDALTLLKNGANYTGIDITPENVVRTKQHLKFFGFEPDVSAGDAESLSFTDKSFDIVYSNGVLHHTPNIERSFAEAARVLKPGGDFYVILYHRNSIFARISSVLSAVIRGIPVKDRIPQPRAQ